MNLNLPALENPRLRRTPRGLDIYDPLRAKFVALTPEETVRQHFTSFLVNQRGFPASLMANEVSLKLNGTSRRCDTVVFDSDLKPFVIIEYKASDVPVSQAVFEQILRYNIVLHARYLIVSNGLRHFCCRIDYENGRHRFLTDIPRYNEL